MQKQNRTLTVHPHLIFQTIHSQAGSLAKALLEGVMNSCDAGCSKVEITLNEGSFKITDDGAGFESEDEIYQMFEQFGTPHKDGDARFGRFRIGRGQLFSYSVSTWHSSNFTMVVDIKNKGLDYTLTSNPKIIHDGCIVLGDLYESLSNSQLQSTLKEIHSMVKWIDVDVMINGKQASSRPEDAKWDYEDEFAYYKIMKDTQYLDLYNQGALVDRSYIRDYGVGAIVVSKQALTLNQARNSILESQCKIYPEIRKTLKQLGRKRIQRAPRLTKKMREHTFEQFFNNEMTYDDIHKLKLMKLSNGKTMTISEVLRSNLPISMIPFNGYERSADTLIQTERALILSREMLDCIPTLYQETNSEYCMASQRQYKRSIETLFALIKNTFINEYEHNQSYQLERSLDLFQSLNLVEFLPLIEKLSEKMEEIRKDADLAPQERAAIKALRAANRTIFWHNSNCVNRRKIIAGNSDVAKAWTDGERWIAIERRVLQHMDKSFNGMIYVLQLLLHEYAHTSDDTDSHDHDFTFFEKFHDLTMACTMGTSLKDMHRTYGRELIAEGLEPKVWLESMNAESWQKNKR